MFTKIQLIPKRVVSTLFKFPNPLTSQITRNIVQRSLFMKNNAAFVYLENQKTFHALCWSKQCGIDNGKYFFIANKFKPPNSSPHSIRWTRKSSVSRQNERSRILSNLWVVITFTVHGEFFQFFVFSFMWVGVNDKFLVGWEF